jgi:hypothetical protein
MNAWLRRLRGAVGMGIAWAVGGALVGGVMEFIANFVPGLNTVDMWIPLFAMPGFVGGTVFSIVLGIAARRRKFHELSLPMFAALGAIGGVLLGAFALSIGFGGDLPILLKVPWAVGPITLFSTAMATGTLALARMGEPRRLPEGEAGVGLTGRE